MMESLDSELGSTQGAHFLPSMRSMLNRDKNYVTRCLDRYRSSANDCPGVKFNEFKHIFGGNKGVVIATFTSFDTDRNGLVDVNECFSVLILSASLPPLQRARLLFDLHDENLDQELSKHGEIAMMRALV